MIYQTVMREADQVFWKVFKCTDPLLKSQYPSTRSPRVSHDSRSKQNTRRSVHLARSPFSPLHAQLHRRQPPILTMVVAATRHARPGLRLLLVEHRQQAEDQRDAGVELDAHQAVGDGLGDVFKVHRLALDQDADGDDGVEGAGGRGRLAFGVEGEGGQVGGAGAEEVAGAE